MPKYYINESISSSKMFNGSYDSSFFNYNFKESVPNKPKIKQ